MAINFQCLPNCTSTILKSAYDWFLRYLSRHTSSRTYVHSYKQYQTQHTLYNYVAEGSYVIIDPRECCSLRAKSHWPTSSVRLYCIERLIFGDFNVLRYQGTCLKSCTGIILASLGVPDASERIARSFLRLSTWRWCAPGELASFSMHVFIYVFTANGTRFWAPRSCLRALPPPPRSCEWAKNRKPQWSSTRAGVNDDSHLVYYTLFGRFVLGDIFRIEKIYQWTIY